MAKGVKTGGRQKGTPNKVSGVCKDVIAQVAHELGGAEGMLAWVQENDLNRRAFWTSIYPKLLPLTVQGDPTAPLAVTIMQYAKHNAPE